MKTLSQILIDMNAILDLEAALPTGTEETARTNYVDQAVWDASASGQLSEFKREFMTSASSLATISLPSNFRELQEDPQLYVNGGWQEWPAIELEDKYNHSMSERYCYVMGNPAEGYNLIFNQIEVATQLSVIYQRYPSGLLTLTDVCELSDPQYVVRQGEAYVLYARGDNRFPVAEQKAATRLANMMGREMKSASGLSRDTKMKFRHPLQNLA